MTLRVCTCTEFTASWYSINVTMLAIAAEQGLRASRYKMPLKKSKGLSYLSSY